MKGAYEWVRRRRWTLALAVFFLSWYALQMGVFQLFGEDVARWWFYFERPPDAVSPGIIFAPISHDFYTLTHIGANLVFLIIAGGLAEPYIGKGRILLLVIGLGYLGIYIANATAVIHRLWIVAGASGGILALWSYAGFRMRHRVTEYISNGLTWSRRSVETVGIVLLLVGIPVFLLHETLWVKQPHSGHTIGLLLGMLYGGIESYFGHSETIESEKTRNRL